MSFSPFRSTRIDIFSPRNMQSSLGGELCNICLIRGENYPILGPITIWKRAFSNLASYKNLDKIDVLAVFKKIKASAQEFESKHENDPNAVNAVFVHWVGFFLDEDFHDMDDFDIDDYIEPRYFQLTEKG